MRTYGAGIAPNTGGGRLRYDASLTNSYREVGSDCTERRTESDMATVRADYALA